MQILLYWITLRKKCLYSELFRSVFSRIGWEITDQNNSEYGHFLHSVNGFYVTKGKSLLDYTNLVSPNEYKKKDKTILKYFE